MNTWKRLSALLAAGALGFAMFGTALAATPASDQGVIPTAHDGNIGYGGNKTAPDCVEADAVETGNTGGSGTSDNGVTVTWTYDSETKEFGFTATDGLVVVAYVKGGDGYNEYDYSEFLNGGVESDGGMFAPDNGSEGPAGLSHAVFCTGPGGEDVEPTPTFGQTLEAETDAPTDDPEFSDEVDDLTESPTDTIGKTGTTSPADGAWLLVVALGVLLASIVVLTPARAKSQR